MILGGVPASLSHSYAVVMHLLRTASRLLIVFLDAPSLRHCALNCSTWWAVICSMGILLKNGIRDERRILRFIFSSVNLLFGTAYTSYHFHANSSNVSCRGTSAAALSTLSPRASFCLRVASYASAPARELSGLRFLYRVWFALKSIHHEFLIIRTAIIYWSTDFTRCFSK